MARLLPCGIEDAGRQVDMALSSDDQRIIGALSPRTWTAASDLADAFGVTSRTIRNRITRINEGAGRAVIESSHKGYRLAAPVPEGDHGHRPQADALIDTMEKRAGFIVRRLIGSVDPLDIYELADELCVSDSTFQVCLKRARDEVRPFHLSIERKRNTVALAGTELDKRHFITHLISTRDPAGFLSLASSDLLSNIGSAPAVLAMVAEELSHANLEHTDFGLNNIVLHVLVMADRVRSGSVMADGARASEVLESAPYRASRAICHRLAHELGRSMPHEGGENEAYYLALVIATNTREPLDRSMGEHDLASYIDPRSIALTEDAVRALETTYCLEPFDEQFVIRMAVHIHSLLHRAKAGSFARNPLTRRTKDSYPLFYDMAVFFANMLSRGADVEINEDEIAFLAFHIGGYFENSRPDNSKLTCCFLFIDYHDIHRAALERIRSRYEGQLAITSALPLSACDPRTLSHDIVFSPVPLEAPRAGNVIVVGPFLTDAEMKRLDREVAAAMREKEGARLTETLHHFMMPQLFQREHYEPDATAMIHHLAAECIREGLCRPEFTDEVLRRETLSPTAFGNSLAVPHSMSAAATRSFLSIVINSKPMPWGDQEVKMIMMLGISEVDRPSFHLLFDNLLEILSERDSVELLLRSTGYDDFIAKLQLLISEVGRD